MTIDLRTHEVEVPIPGGATMPVDLREHRYDIVQRLFSLHVTRDTLCALLPEWTPLIDRVAGDLQRG